MSNGTLTAAEDLSGIALKEFPNEVISLVPGKDIVNDRSNRTTEAEGDCSSRHVDHRGVPPLSYGSLLI